MARVVQRANARTTPSVAFCRDCPVRYKFDIQPCEQPERRRVQLLRRSAHSGVSRPVRSDGHADDEHKLTVEQQEKVKALIQELGPQASPETVHARLHEDVRGESIVNMVKFARRAARNQIPQRKVSALMDWHQEARVRA